MTRCPLVLQLRRLENKAGQIKQSELVEYGEFLHRKGERYYDFNKIRNEIED